MESLKTIHARAAKRHDGDTAPTSRKAMDAVQGAFNRWRKESGRSLTEIGRTLAMSIDARDAKGFSPSSSPPRSIS